MFHGSLVPCAERRIIKMTTITLTENDIEDLKAGNKIKMILSSEKSEDIRVCITAISKKKERKQYKNQ